MLTFKHIHHEVIVTSSSIDVQTTNMPTLKLKFFWFDGSDLVPYSTKQSDY